MATYQITQPDGSLYEITQPDAAAGPAPESTSGMVRPGQTGALSPFEATRRMLGEPPGQDIPSRQQLIEQGAPMLGQALGQLTPAGPIGGAAGAMAAFAMQRKVQTGAWPTWRELGLQGTLALAPAMVSGVARGLRGGLAISPPGRMATRTQALSEFDALQAQAGTQIGQIKAGTGADVAQLERMAARTRGLREQYSAAAKEMQTKEIAARRLTLSGLRESGVTTAREFVQRLPSLTEGEIQALYAKVATYKFTMPTDLLTQTQAEIARDVGLVQKFFPQAGLGERARLATQPAITAPAPRVSALVDAFGNPIAHPGPPSVIGTMTFEESHGLLKWLGQRIGSLQKATTPDAGEQLGAAKLLYSRLQQSLDRAAQSATVPQQAREALRAANFAYKQQATTESLADAIEGAISTNMQGQLTLNPGRLLDTLRKGKTGTFLAERLREVGLLDSVEQTFRGIGTDIRAAAQAIPASRARFAAQAVEIIPPLREQEARMLAAAQGRTAQAAAQVQGLKAQAAAQVQELEAQVTARQAALPAPARPPSLRAMTDMGLLMGGMTMLLTGGHYSKAGAVASLAATPLILARLLMTDPGQRLVRSALAQNIGVLDEPMLQLLASTALRSIERTPANTTGGQGPTNVPAQ